jgi:UDP-glucose 4-epimerase
MAHPVFIIGKGGMLGSALTQLIGSYAEDFYRWNDAGPFAWHDLERLDTQFTDSCDAFLKHAVEAQKRFILIWTAGKAVMSSSDADLQHEMRVFEHFLRALHNAMHTHGSPPGTIILMSSAGALYGATEDAICTENTTLQPSSTYGNIKLKQEVLLAEWLRLHPGLSSGVMRLSTLYGPGQKLDKPQGLISHLLKCTLTHETAHIYVPLDTMRDYLYITDAAIMIYETIQELERAARRLPIHITKIIASEEHTTVAQIIAMGNKLAKRPMRITYGRNAASIHYRHKLEFKSMQWPDLSHVKRTTLLEGMTHVHQDLLSAFQRGELAPKHS